MSVPNPANRAARARRRTRVGIFIGIFVVLALGAWIDVVMHQMASKRASEHKVTFAEYVHNHHLGTLEVIDDGTGMNAVAYDLQLNRSVPDAQRVSLALSLIETYAKDDHGELLTIDHIDPQTHLDEPIATCTLNETLTKLTLTVHFSDGQQKVINRQVNW